MELSPEGTELIITNEADQKFAVDLATRAVRPAS